MEAPVIFLAFANDQDAHLALLDKERKAITDHLLPLANKNYFQFFSEPSTTSADLINRLAEFKDRIGIFHYGGHAGSAKIFLNDGAADAQGLAQLLGIQKNLKLVFLNGCSTLDQVKNLFAQGAPAVIATSVPVGDASAQEFSTAFYQALSTQHTLEEAFKLASAGYLMKTGQAAGINRGFDLSEKENLEELPWGLYVSPGKDEILTWKLPMTSAASFIVRGAGYRHQEGGSVNDKIIQTIANAIEEYSSLIKSMVNEARQKGREVKIRDLRVAVIDSFPTPIGTHLRKLLLSEDVSTDRLQKIVNVYAVSVEMLAYIMLSQLWDEKVNTEKFLIPEEANTVLKDFFNLSPEKLPVYNYLQLIRAVSEIFNANKVEPFVAEFGDLQKSFYAEESFQKAHLFLEEMKKELEGTIAANEIESFCVQAENHLCEIFRHLGFCAKYTLATIKSIDLQKIRHKPPSYIHNLVILDRITAAIGVLDDILVADNYTESKSVILLRNEDELHPYLNLSPLIIDQNALIREQNSKLFFYRYQTNGQYYFVLVDNLKDTLEVTDRQFQDVKEIFDRFAKVTFKDG